MYPAKPVEFVITVRLMSAKMKTKANPEGSLPPPPLPAEKPTRNPRRNVIPRNPSTPNKLPFYEKAKRALNLHIDGEGKRSKTFSYFAKQWYSIDVKKNKQPWKFLGSAIDNSALVEFQRLSEGNFGVFAKVDIPSSTYISELRGWTMFAGNEIFIDRHQVSKITFKLDGGKGGKRASAVLDGPVYFVNHHCVRKNVEFIAVRDHYKLRIEIRSLREIKKGEELLAFYGPSYFELGDCWCCQGKRYRPDVKYVE